MRRDAPPLSPRIEALLRAERQLVAQTHDFRERVLDRARGAKGQPIARPLPGGGRRALAFALAAAAIVVFAIGAAAYQTWRRSDAMLAKGRGSDPAAPSVLTLAPAAPPGSSQTAEIGPAPRGTQPLEAAVCAGEPATITPGARPSRAAHGGNGVDELRLLERARQSLARRSFAEALTALASHEQRFPVGRLAEEREALKITALVGSNRPEDASRTAAQFRRRFPHSVLLPRIDDLVKRP